MAFPAQCKSLCNTQRRMGHFPPLIFLSGVKKNMPVSISVMSSILWWCAVVPAPFSSVLGRQGGRGKMNVLFCTWRERRARFGLSRADSGVKQRVLHLIEVMMMSLASSTLLWSDDFMHGSSAVGLKPSSHFAKMTHTSDFSLWVFFFFFFQNPSTAYDINFRVMVRISCVISFPWDPNGSGPSFGTQPFKSTLSLSFYYTVPYYRQWLTWPQIP